MNHLPSAVQNRIWVLLIAAAVDLAVGDPPRLWHPVQGIGALIVFFEKVLRALFAVPPPGGEPTQPPAGIRQGTPDEEPQASPGEELRGTSDEVPQASPGKELRGTSDEEPQASPGKELQNTSDEEPKASPGKELQGLRDEESLASPNEELRASSRKRRERVAGVILVLLVLSVSTGAALLLLEVCGRVHPALKVVLEGVLCGRLLALRSLAEAGVSVCDPLLRGNVEEARSAVSMIVGRDTRRLDADGITRAAVETVAENASDGVTAPLFYMFLFGGIGGVFYKAVNTLDSMTGYKNDRYRYFGTAAARLDDLLNLVPSRLTALLMILACTFTSKASVPLSGREGGSAHRVPSDCPSCLQPGRVQKAKADPPREVLLPDAAAAFRIWKRDRQKSPSPNSGQTESVCAGALHLRLLGDAWYFGELHHKAEIGDGGRRPVPEDITRAVRLMEGAAVLLFVLGLALLVSAGMIVGRMQ